MAEADEVNKLAEATQKLRDAEEKLAYARSDEAKEVAKLERQTQALADQTRTIEQSYAQWSDLGKELKDGLFAPLKGIVSAIPGPLQTIGKMISKGAMDLGSLVMGKREKNPELENINKGIQELVEQGEGPDSSVANETSLESGDGGDTPKPDKGGPFGKAFKAIGAWIKKFLTWKTLIIGVLAAIVGGLAIKYWEPIKEFVVDKIIPALEKIVEVLTPIVDSIKAWTTETLLPTVVDFFIQQWKNVVTLFDNIKARFDGWNQMDFKEKIFAILGVFEDLGTYVADTARNMLVSILNLFGVDGEAMATKYFDPIRQVFSDLIDWVKLAFTDPKAALSALWSGLLGGAATIGGWIWDNALEPTISWVMDKFAWAGDIIKAGWTNITDFISGIYDKVVDFFARMFDWAGDIVKAGWDGLVGFVTGAYDKVVEFFTRMFAWGGDIVKEGWTGLVGFVTGAYDKVVEFFTRLFSWGGDVVKEGWTGLTDFVSGAYDNAVNFVKDKLAWGGDVVKEGWTGLTDFATSSYDGAVGFMQDKLAWGGDIVKEGWTGLTNFATGSYDTATGFFKDKFAFVSDKLEGFSLLDTMREAVKNIKNFFFNDEGTGLLDFDFSGFSMPDFNLNAMTEKIKDLVRGIVDFLPDFLVPDSIAEWLALPPQPTAADYIADPQAKVYQGPEAMAAADVANKVYKKPDKRPGFPAVVSAPTTDNSVTSAPTFNFRGGSRGAAASDSYTLAQGRNQRSRFSN